MPSDDNDNLFQPYEVQDYGLASRSTHVVCQFLSMNTGLQFLIRNVNKIQLMAPSRKFMECLQFAALKHRDQRRKNANQTPYINHPINVATILSTEGYIDDESVLMSALLHDTVEDTDTSFKEIEEHFGTEVCNIVREVTDDKTLEKQVRKQLQIETASNCSYKAKLVKLADKLDNLRDLEQVIPTGWTEERRNEYFIWAKKVVDNLRGTNKEIENKLDDIFRKRHLL